jgi:hypothetical protein
MPWYYRCYMYLLLLVGTKFGTSRSTAVVTNRPSAPLLPARLIVENAVPAFLFDRNPGTVLNRLNKFITAYQCIRVRILRMGYFRHEPIFSTWADMVLSGEGVQLFMYALYIWYSMKYTGQYIVITFSTGVHLEPDHFEQIVRNIVRNGPVLNVLMVITIYCPNVRYTSYCIKYKMYT